MSCPAVRSSVLAVLAIAVSAAPTPGGAAAGEERNPLPRFLESLQVGPAVEHRFAVVHPILVAPPPAEVLADANRPVVLAATAPDSLGVPPAARENRAAVRLANLGKRPLWALPGDLFRLGDGDHVVLADRAVPAGESAEVPTVRVAGVLAEESPREEPRRLGSIPGPALLWVTLASPKDFTGSGLAAELAREAGADTPRRSPGDLSRGTKIAKRVGEYRARLATLPRPAAAGRREIAGYAVVLDGGFAGVEVFADPARFAAVWPERAEGIAVEASLLEAEGGALDAVLDVMADPDRFTAAVKDAILAMYALEPKPERLDGLGSVLGLSKEDDAGRAVVGPAGSVEHVLRVRDPSRRHAAPTKEGEDPLDPGVLSRKARLTEFEKRWLERRRTAPVPRPEPRRE